MRPIAIVLFSLALVSGRAEALPCPPETLPCMTIYYVCNDGLPAQSTSTTLAPSVICSGTCIEDYTVFQPQGTACTSDGDPCTSDACDGDGACQHVNVTGGKTCGTPTCYAASACCGDADCAGVSNGSGSCPTIGGSCAIVCDAGYKQCGATCIPQAQCCVDGDCPSDPAGHRHGVCGGGSCAYACDGGYKACSGACIPTSWCCGAASCVTPPNGCYKQQGSCSTADGTCSYTYDDGAACDADGTKCTPNDRCQNGACIADTANTVKCVRRECHTTPACNPATGNCDDALVADTTACGANGCNDAAGTCTSGMCSAPPKDCTALDDDCRVGICDPSQPVGTACTTTNKPNGLACSLADKCMLSTACSGGSCVGTPKVCDPSAPCRVAACNPTTGGCEESIAPVGTACSLDDACVQNAQCDAVGACSGDTVPDGTPCDKPGCSATAACVTGTCICIDGSSDAPPSSDPSPDMATDGGEPGSGCAFVGPMGSAEVPFVFLLLVACLVVLRKPLSRNRR